jgi:hypothetical protein
VLTGRRRDGDEELDELDGLKWTNAEIREMETTTGRSR